MVTSDPSSDDTRIALELLEGGHATLGVGDLSAVYREAERFFALPEQERSAASLPSGCGYLPFGREHSGDPTKPDHVDIFVASPRMVAAARRIPSEPARALHAAMMVAFDVLEARAEAVSRAIASAVGDEDVAERVAGSFRSWSLLQLHRARPLAAGRLINEPHEDGHVLTLAHATDPGLEIEAAGTFVTPTRATDEMLVMPGHALTLLTGGAVPSLRHRVVAHASDRPRTSLMFFADLDPDRCAPWRSTSFNEGIDIGAFVRGNSRRFGVEGFEPA